MGEDGRSPADKPITSAPYHPAADGVDPEKAPRDRAARARAPPYRDRGGGRPAGAVADAGGDPRTVAARGRGGEERRPCLRRRVVPPGARRPLRADGLAAARDQARGRAVPVRAVLRL